MGSVGTAAATMWPIRPASYAAIAARIGARAASFGPPARAVPSSRRTRRAKLGELLCGRFASASHAGQRLPRAAAQLAQNLRRAAVGERPCTAGRARRRRARSSLCGNGQWYRVDGVERQGRFLPG